jgi:hypothetical protein
MKLYRHKLFWQAFLDLWAKETFGKEENNIDIILLCAAFEYDISLAAAALGSTRVIQSMRTWEGDLYKTDLIKPDVAEEEYRKLLKRYPPDERD